MELKPSCKQTAAGMIPKDWCVAQLGTHATFKTGPFGSALHQSDYVDGGVPVINPMQIVNGQIRPTPSMAITDQAARKLSEFRLSAGNVVIGRRGEMGRCAVVQTEAHGWLCGTGSMVVRTGPSLEANFLQRVLSSHPVIKAIENTSVGSTMININQGTLRNLCIPLPPKAEQEAIAEVLNDADALIESLGQLLVKKRQIKQGAMQELLSGKRRLPGFEKKLGYQQTEMGAISQDWEVKAVHEFALIKTGPFGTLLKASEYSEGDGVPLISVGEIREGFLRISSQTPRVAEAVTRRLPQYVLRSGDIVFGRKGGVERSALVRQSQEGWFLGSDGISVRPTQDCSAEYLALQFQSKRVQLWLLQNAIGTTMPSLNQRILRNVAIPFPRTKAEQDAIVAILSDMGAEIAALEAKLTKARQLKQGMMQELLTGRIRLV